VKAGTRLVAAALACLLLVGCSTKAQRWYRRAEAFFSQGKYQLAITEYYRVVTNAPHDSLADDAIYKIAYIYREDDELGDLATAVAWYQQLASDYPNSSYADDALLWVVDIQTRRLQDLEGARATVDEIRRRFAGNAGVCTRAQLQLARLLDDKGFNDEAIEICKQIVEQPGSPSNTAANAALLMARIAEGTAENPEEAVPEYEKVVERYPDTVAAVRAKQAIGWIVFGVNTQEQERLRLEKERRARVIPNVPPFADPQSAPLRQLLGALRSLLLQVGTELTEAQVWGISGAAFQFVFDPANPDATSTLCQENPLTTLADELGFTYGQWAQGVDSNALVTIEQSLHSGRAVLILYGGPRWSLVTGYRPAEERVLVLSPGAQSAVTVPVNDFMRNWRSAPAGGLWRPASKKGFQFVIDERGTPSDDATVARRSLARAVTLAEHRSVAGVPCGRAAYEALLTQVRQAAMVEGEQQRAYLVKWAGRPLQCHIFARQQAAGYLREVSGVLTGLQSQAAANTAGRYETIAQQWTDLAQELRGTAEDQTISEDPVIWANILVLAQRVCDEELAAIEELTLAAGG